MRRKRLALDDRQPGVPVMRRETPTSDVELFRVDHGLPTHAEIVRVRILDGHITMSLHTLREIARQAC